MRRQPPAIQDRIGRKAWSVAVVLAILLQGLLALAPAQASDGFALDAASICSSAVKASGEADRPHDPSASHCPLCQNLQPSLGLSPASAVVILARTKPERLVPIAATGIARAVRPAGFHSRAPPISS